MFTVEVPVVVGYLFAFLVLISEPPAHNGFCISPLLIPYGYTRTLNPVFLLNGGNLIVHRALYLLPLYGSS